MVRAICTARLGTGGADDATQEIFLKAWRGLGRLTEPARFAAYVGRIARNHCVDQLRTLRRSKAVSLDAVELDVANAADEDVDRGPLLHKLRSEVGRLPESQREVLLLFYVHQMSYAAMADALGVTEAAVNQRLSRARQTLRRSFAGVRGPEDVA